MIYLYLGHTNLCNCIRTEEELRSGFIFKNITTKTDLADKIMQVRRFSKWNEAIICSLLKESNLLQSKQYVNFLRYDMI